MLWVWLMGLITLGLLVWFGMKVFSGGVSPEDGSTASTTSADGSSSGGDSEVPEVAGANAAASAEATADASADNTHKASAGSAAAMGAVAATGAAAAAASATTGDADEGSAPGPAKADNGIVVNKPVAAGSAGLGESGHAQGVADAVASEDAGSVREMIKILNLRDSDASRLGIEKDQFEALWQGNSDGIAASTVSDVRSRLQQMMS